MIYIKESSSNDNDVSNTINAFLHNLFVLFESTFRDTQFKDNLESDFDCFLHIFSKF